MCVQAPCAQMMDDEYMLYTYKVRACDRKVSSSGDRWQRRAAFCRRKHSSSPVLPSGQEVVQPGHLVLLRALSPAVQQQLKQQEYVELFAARSTCLLLARQCLLVGKA